MLEIMGGKTTPTQNAAFLAALSTKSTKAETIDEIYGCAEAMRSLATPVPHPGMEVMEIVGTGGDGAHSFNISTTSAMVLAAGGVKVAKHREPGCFFPVRYCGLSGSPGGKYPAGSCPGPERCCRKPISASCSPRNTMRP